MCEVFCEAMYVFMCAYAVCGQCVQSYPLQEGGKAGKCRRRRGDATRTADQGRTRMIGFKYNRAPHTSPDLSTGGCVTWCCIVEGGVMLAAAGISGDLASASVDVIAAVGAVEWGEGEVEFDIEVEVEAVPGTVDVVAAGRGDDTVDAVSKVEEEGEGGRIWAEGMDVASGRVDGGSETERAGEGARLEVGRCSR